MRDWNHYKIRSIAWTETAVGCWECSSHSRTSRGYVHASRDHHDISLHRFMWQECFGEIPPGMMVCHRCDNRSCINPEHLFLGTCKDNMQDCATKGRTLRGALNFKTKLNDADVLAIRESKLSQRELARRYNVTQANIWSIRANKTWRHVRAIMGQ